ncbi:hypothetical protein MPLDJ20_20280 [Mesorhizobium plurifarium]|uniref:Uncharacterized protein n=1 Tax=Mesorhizobium plurifarium TaxID=69974 RepID=A0A090F1V9_MESPL|nr:hypothetical protein MPLDJ20_20280 [Mesorhizobium plurifarium]
MLQWLPDHRALLPRLVNLLKSGGILATQVPDNLNESTHRGMREVARDPRWAGRLAEGTPSERRSRGLRIITAFSARSAGGWKSGRSITILSKDWTVSSTGSAALACVHTSRASTHPKRRPTLLYRDARATMRSWRRQQRFCHFHVSSLSRHDFRLDF